MHEKISGLLPDYVNGLLAGELEKRVEQHISECAECAGELSLLKDINDIEVPDPGPEFWETCPAQAVSAAGDVKARKPLFRISNFKFRYILPPAAAAAALLLGFLIHGAHQGEKQPPTIAQVYFGDPLSSEFAIPATGNANGASSGFEGQVDTEIGEALASNQEGAVNSPASSQVAIEDTGQADYAPDYGTDLDSLGPKGLERLGRILNEYKAGGRPHDDNASGYSNERIMG